MVELKKEKTEIIALLSCSGCSLHEPKCNICGKDFTNRTQIIYCEEVEHYRDNKHYCNRCNKNMKKRQKELYE